MIAAGFVSLDAGWLGRVDCLLEAGWMVDDGNLSTNRSGLA
jgi:hypothetical protein